MTKVGINTNMFSAHSKHHAFTSAMDQVLTLRSLEKQQFGQNFVRFKKMIFSLVFITQRERR